MILHYLKVAVRSLMKYKMQTAISVVGLAVGFVCLAFSMIWIRYELTYDDFHRGAERMYVLCAKSGLELDGITTSMTFPLAKDLKRIFPEVEEAAAFSHWKVPVGKDREERIELWKVETDSAFFRLFDVRLLEGSWSFLHNTEKEVALTEEGARRIFRTTEGVLGKELYVYGEPHKVTALVSSWSKHSNFYYDVMLGQDEKTKANWQWLGQEVCFRLHEGTDEQAFADKLGRQVKWGTGATEYFRDLMMEQLTRCRYTLYQDTTQVALQYIRLFSVVSVLIIGVALINFFSMMVMRIRIRRREIGLRVMCGSTMGGLFRLFASELFLLFFSSGLLGMALLEATRDKFCELSSVEGGLYLPSLGYFFLVFAVAMAVSALLIRYYSRKSIAEGLSHMAKNVRGQLFFQQGCIVLQLTVSLGILFGLSVLLKQLNYLSNTDDLGFERDGRATFGFYPREEGVFDQIKQLPYVQEVKEIYSLLPRRGGASSHINTWDGNQDGEDAFDIQTISEGQEFMDFYGIRLLQGTPLSEQTTEKNPVLINETAAKRFGWDDPLGKHFGYVNPQGERFREYTVVGVFKDYHVSAPTDPVQPVMLIGNNAQGLRYSGDVVISFDEARVADLRKAIGTMIGKLDGHHDYTLETANETYEKYLTSERSLLKLLTFVAVVCVVISLFGVYSHVTLACERRRKEIAIRKVNGATAWLIMQSFLKQYAWMLLLSCLIAFPVGTLVMRRWLEQYVEQTTINGWLYGLIMVILALFIGLCTGRSVWRAAHENPAEVIKRE